MDIQKMIRNVPDFPEKGVIFRDITPLLLDSQTLIESIDSITNQLKDVDFDLIVGPESRGFIFGVPVAYNMKKGFVPVRKAGKLPYRTKRKSYSLEYGTATIEIHEDAILKGQKVVVVDDLLATGGTSAAMADLIRGMGGEVVRMVFLIELDGLNGREMLKGLDVRSIMKF